ncbi:MAG: hypothetical protein LBI99_09730, partial [Propionibacteriaceae bacterium]|nr:hypothetical protein [Propionibacteriaceae bacterium]
DDWINAAEWAKKCTWNQEQTTSPRFDKVWWLSLPNPFVVVADAAPLPPGVSDLNNYTDFYADPLAMIKIAVRRSALPPETERDDCLHLVLVGEDSEFGYDDEGNVWVTNNGIRSPYTSPVKNPPLNIDTPIWPWGMGIDLVLGAGFFIIAWRRLRVPYGKLPQGQRVA